MLRKSQNVAQKKDEKQEKKILEAWSRRSNTQIEILEKTNSEHKREETIKELIQENFPQLRACISKLKESSTKN